MLQIHYVFTLNIIYHSLSLFSMWVYFDSGSYIDRGERVMWNNILNIHRILLQHCQTYSVSYDLSVDT